MNRLTPFRVAVVMYIGYLLIIYLGEPSNFTSSGGSAWSGVAMIAILFWGLVFWLADILMRRSIKDGRIIWGIQLITILTMYLFLDW